MLRCVTHFSTYVGCKTTTLRTFQDRIQGTPEAGIGLQHIGIHRSIWTKVSPETTCRSGKEHEGHDEHSRIQDVDVVVTLCEELLLRVPCLLHYLLVQLIARLQPPIAPRTRERALVREAEA